jgi:hypothetical protein
MEMYDLFDVDTNNLVRSFATEKDALAMVERAIRRSGPESVEAWVLSRTDFTGPVLSGNELVARATGQYIGR